MCCYCKSKRGYQGFASRSMAAKLVPETDIDPASVRSMAGEEDPSGKEGRLAPRWGPQHGGALLELGFTLQVRGARLPNAVFSFLQMYLKNET